MSKVFSHPAVLLLEKSRQYARAELRPVTYQRAIGYLLRRVLKKEKYECWGVRYEDKGNKMLGPGRIHPLVMTMALHTAPGGSCPVCGVRNWCYMSGAAKPTMSCAGCGSIYILKASDLRKGVPQNAETDTGGNGLGVGRHDA